MNVRFGYVALALDLQNASPNKTVTVSNLMKLPEGDRLLKLRLLTRQNLHNQLRVLRYNAAYDIFVYRFTSRLVPLVTHDIAAGWRYDEEFADEFAAIGDFVREHAMRTGFHPDHFVQIGAQDAAVYESSVAILHAHDVQCRAMGFDDAVKCNIHLGGFYGDRVAAQDRFRQQFRALPPHLAHRITLENDDRTFTARETLACATALGVPMVLDLHHHACNHEEDSDWFDLWPAIAQTWASTGLPPKIHISSPKGTASGTAFRSHADWIDPTDLLPALRRMAPVTTDVDVMIEAKQKDLALRQLMKDLTGAPGVTVCNQASIDVEPESALVVE